jgi:F0F1-type ATP synthase membrane subunit b/b'
MSTFAIVVLVLAIGAIATFIAMKTGKVADANNNNIPDAIETKVEAVKEAVADVKKAVAKVTEAPKAKAPKAKSNAPKKTKK